MHTLWQQQHSLSGWSLCVSHSQACRLAWSSPEGPSSASGGCVATVVTSPGREVSSPWAKAGPRETAVCGANTRTICSLGPNLEIWKYNVSYKWMEKVYYWKHESYIFCLQNWFKLNRFQNFFKNVLLTWKWVLKCKDLKNRHHFCVYLKKQDILKLMSTRENQESTSQL